MISFIRNNPLVRYVRESKQELKKVTWPSRQRVIKDTVIVVGLSAAVAIFFGLMDYFLAAGFQRFLQV
ncbi:hypothetical protein AMJ57_05810 [Parcubacteria bacterium SG8_24]|nr:MAG: hypothetical protein AMJ57_05810 [Parcubacteria bacterium SG8_24]